MKIFKKHLEFFKSNLQMLFQKENENGKKGCIPMDLQKI